MVQTWRESSIPVVGELLCKADSPNPLLCCMWEKSIMRASSLRRGWKRIGSVKTSPATLDKTIYFWCISYERSVGFLSDSETCLWFFYERSLRFRLWSFQTEIKCIVWQPCSIHSVMSESTKYCGNNFFNQHPVSTFWSEWPHTDPW